MSKRKFSSRERRTKNRDARLIIIAAEGTNTEPQYFSALREAYRSPRIYVEILKREFQASAPEHVMTVLDEFKRTYDLDTQDELWLVVDYDQWGEGKLSQISTQCRQKQYMLAVSNPAFELWLLLHVAALSNYTDAILKSFLDNRKHEGRTPIEHELLRILGKYNKANLDTNDFLPHVRIAIHQAEVLDINPDYSWINGLGTRVYRLVKSIMEMHQPIP